MSRLHANCPGSDCFGRIALVDALVRNDDEEDEDEEESDHRDDDNEDEEDDGYSE